MEAHDLQLTNDIKNTHILGVNENGIGKRVNAKDLAFSCVYLFKSETGFGSGTITLNEKITNFKLINIQVGYVYSNGVAGLRTYTLETQAFFNKFHNNVVLFHASSSSSPYIKTNFNVDGFKVVVESYASGILYSIIGLG